MNILIRRLHQDDLETVAQIEADVQVHPWSRTQILAVADLLNDNYLAWVLVQENRIDAYLIVQCVVDAFEILSFGVVAEQQRKGFALKLWQYAWQDMCQTYPQISTCYLEVRISNQAAQSLYARCGFEIVGRRRNYYQNPTEDALILQRNDQK